MSYDDEFSGPGITYNPPYYLGFGFNSSLGLMDPTTGSISFIGKMSGIVFPDCDPLAGFCYGNTVRSLYMGPDQQLYGTAWEIAASIVPTFLYKIDKTNANSQVVCQFLPFFLYYQTVGIGIDSTGIMYWKRPGTNDVRVLDLTTCIISAFSLNFNATASTLYFDKLYFIDPAGRMLRIDPPNPTVVDTGYDTGIIYGVPPPISLPGPSEICFTDDQCWAPTTFFPYVNAALQTDLRTAYGTPDKTSQPFHIVDPDTTTTTLFLNRSITGTGQIVYGAAPTCYHNISVNIPDIVKRAPMSVSAGEGVLYMSAPIPPTFGLFQGGSLLSLYDRASNMALPLGRMGTTQNITRLFMSPAGGGGQLYGVDTAQENLYTISGGGVLTPVCSMSNVVAVFGFESVSSTIIVQTSGGNIAGMDALTCTVSPTVLATHACGTGGTMFGDVLYCVDGTNIVSVMLSGVVTTLGAHGATIANIANAQLFKYCHDGTSTLALFHDHQFSDVNILTGTLSNTVPFTLGSGAFDWFPSSSVWCA